MESDVRSPPPRTDDMLDEDERVSDRRQSRLGTATRTGCRSSGRSDERCTCVVYNAPQYNEQRQQSVIAGLIIGQVTS